MTTKERASRAEQIVTARSEGATWDEISAEVGASPRQCRRIADDYRVSQPVLDKLDPIAAVEKAYARYDAIVEDLREIVATDTNGATKVGALKAEMTAIEAQMGLLGAVGVLPRNLGDMRVTYDVRALVQVIFGVFDKYGVSREARDEIAEAVRQGRNGTH